jgi:biotin carboxyl carrier protein
MDYEFLYGDTVHRVTLHSKDGKLVARIGDEDFDVDVQTIDDHGLSLILGGRSMNVFIAKSDGKRFVHINGENYCFSIPGAETDAAIVHQEGSGGEAKLSIKAPMPGSVLKIDVKDGDAVEEGACLIIVEAMKMETGLHSSLTGKVKKVHVNAGQQVDAGQLLIELEEN